MNAGPMQVEGVLTEVLLAAPSPSDGQEFTPVSVSPGLEGFFFTFILAALLVLLLVDMARRVRRVQAAARVKVRYEGQERREVDRAPSAEDPGAVTGNPDAVTEDPEAVTGADRTPEAGETPRDEPGPSSNR